MVDRVPATTKQLLGHIPRLEPVLEILNHPAARLSSLDRQPVTLPDFKTTPLPVRILALALDQEMLEAAGIDAAARCARPCAAAPTAMIRRWSTALEAESDWEHDALVIEELRIQDLAVGMSFVDDVKTASGTLLIVRGHDVTPGVARTACATSIVSVGVREPIRVSVTREKRHADHEVRFRLARRWRAAGGPEVFRCNLFPAPAIQSYQCSLCADPNRGTAASAALSDSDIVARVLAGEIELFEVLDAATQPAPVPRRPRHRASDDAEAEDVMQEAYARAFSSSGSSKGARSGRPG